MTTGQTHTGRWAEERKGGVRIETEFWVRVIGRDSEPVRRSGNICGTGFFFRAERWPGQSGDIGVMEVSSEDQLQSFTTMASLVRVIGAKEARFGSVEEGVSFKFLPSDEPTRSAIARTVRHIAELHPEQAGDQLIEDFQRSATEASYPGARESERPWIETGANVRLLVEESATGTRREVSGVVGDITESIQADGATRFWIPVYLAEEQDGLPDATTSGAAATPEVESVEALTELLDEESPLDAVWKELVPHASSIIQETSSSSSPTGRSHLSGRLSQISMPSALWLLDQERLTGLLTLRREGQEVVLYLQEGRVIDAESPDCELTPREHLSALMLWEDGAFEFRVEDVDRVDKLGVATQGLLLDLAVARDESGR